MGQEFVARKGLISLKDIVAQQGISGATVDADNLIDNRIVFSQDTRLQSSTHNISVIDDLLADVITISGDLGSSDFISLNDTPTNYTGADTYVLTVSGDGIVFTPQDEIIPEITNIRGQVECVIGQQTYDISYGQSISGAQPIMSLEVPTSGSTLFVQSSYDITDTGFKVILSEAPATSGYAINWLVSFGSAVDITSLEGRYTDLFTDADISLGILPVNHNLAETHVSVVIYDQNNYVIQPDQIQVVNINNLNIDLSSYGTISGTWTILVLSRGGVGNSSGATSFLDLTNTPDTFAGSDTFTPVVSGSELVFTKTRHLEEFVDGDLSSGVLTLTHNLSQKYVSISVYDNNDKYISPDDITLTDSNSLQLDLSSYVPITGIWRALAISK